MTDATDVLRVENMTIAFGGLRAVDDVSFHVMPGELYGVIGPNGAGKTTLLNGVSGLFPLTQGRVYLRGERIDQQRPHVRAELGISRTFQAAEVFNDFTVLEYLLAGRLRHQRTSLWECALRLPVVRRSEAAEKAAAMAMLRDYDISSFAGRELSSLPYGQRKLIDLLRALMEKPQLLLLDEPTSGTAQEDRVALRDALASAREQGLTTIVVDHDVRFISDMCDRVLVMNFGKMLADGVPSSVLSDEDVIRAYIGSSEA